ncbi:MAG: hypothetical protein SF028_12520 [Candidatus Sumerlaeia bacterium]|nr:hypothetical protein [Candidatus Sumerlaeia bacterium]
MERRIVRSFTVSGPEGEQTYSSLEEMPEELRRRVEAAMASPEARRPPPGDIGFQPPPGFTSPRREAGETRYEVRFSMDRRAPLRRISLLGVLAILALLGALALAAVVVKHL